MQINFDMDGTIADLFGVDNWENKLDSQDTSPFLQAKPLVDMRKLARILNALQKCGCDINVITWLPMNSNANFDKQSARTKKLWLHKHIGSVVFDNIYCLPYGTPKQEYGTDILFDDDKQNRNNWNGTAYDEKNILEILQKILDKLS